MTNETLSNEREFYFAKLRDIEILLQTRGGETSENPITQDILKILYASEDEKVQVASDGKLQISSSTEKAVEHDFAPKETTDDEEMLI